MAKMRKNKCSGTTAEQLPSTTTTKRSSFESFPLYLVPNDNYSSSGNSHNNYQDYDNVISHRKSRELHEYVKGRVWVIPSFFSPKECQAWIDFCESFSDSDGDTNGSNKSSNVGGDGGGGGFQYTAHPASNYIANRECYRMQETNGRELSDRIFKRLQGMTMTTKGMIHCGDGDASDVNNSNNNNNHKNNSSASTSTSILSQIQQETADLYRNEYKPINCNPNLRVYRYNKGHAFGRHVDGSNVVTGYSGDSGNNGNLSATSTRTSRRTRTTTCKTEMTMLLYLSTCEGGATRFHLPSSKRNRRNNNNNNSIAYSPQVGSLLLHVHGNHCLEHEADVVLSGKKYVLRTDLIYG
jgi:hypothetical protein